MRLRLPALLCALLAATGVAADPATTRIPSAPSRSPTPCAHGPRAGATPDHPSRASTSSTESTRWMCGSMIRPFASAFSSGQAGTTRVQ